MDLAWWITYIGIPICSLLLGIDLKIHTDSTRRAKELHERIDKSEQKAADTLKAFYDYKVEAARLFATVEATGEIRRDLKDALGRIEDKIDRLNSRIDEDRKASL